MLRLEPSASRSHRTYDLQGRSGRFRDVSVAIDNLSGDETLALLALHLVGMAENSPIASRFALDLSGLQKPEVTVWSVQIDGRIAAIGALKTLDAGVGEVKSMRTHPDFLRQGAAAAILAVMIATARERGLKRLSLETGTAPAFDSAIALYRKHGFISGPPFSTYQASAFNQFFHLIL